MKSLLIISFVIALSVIAAAGSPYRPTGGSYMVAPGPFSDESEKMHLYLFIEGESAQETWEAMHAQEKLNVCGPDHYQKRVGDLVCSYFPEKIEYSCMILIDLKEGELKGDIPC